MNNLQFDTFLWKIHGIVAEIYANTPNIALARFIFPTPFIKISNFQFPFFLDQEVKPKQWNIQ